MSDEKRWKKTQEKQKIHLDWERISSVINTMETSDTSFKCLHMSGSCTHMFVMFNLVLKVIFLTYLQRRCNKPTESRSMITEANAKEDRGGDRWCIRMQSPIWSLFVSAFVRNIICSTDCSEEITVHTVKATESSMKDKIPACTHWTGC